MSLDEDKNLMVMMVSYWELMLTVVKLDDFDIDDIYSSSSSTID